MNTLQYPTAPRNARRCAMAAVALAAVLMAFAPTIARAQSIDHSGGFDDHGDLARNGTAFFINGLYTEGLTVARLTDGGADEAGSIFTNNLFDITSFSTSFVIQSHAGISGFGDGITFTIQNDGRGSSALGASGQGLGYRGINNSVALKFATWDNPPNQGRISRTGLYVNGQDPVGPSPLGYSDLAQSGVFLGNENPFLVDMLYSGGTLGVTVTDTITGAYANQSYTIDIPSMVGFDNAYLGFTAATGGDRAVQDIRSWTFNAPPAHVPEPGTLSLLAIGAAALSLAARRRRAPRRTL